jgi:AcrR family transcriptional regulator
MSKADRTRAGLREVALRHFVADGFEAASVPAIAAEVGVTERTFYRHFATKDEVLFADLTQGLPWFGAAVAERLDAGEDTIAAVLHGIQQPAADPRVMLEIARLRIRLLSPTRVERAYRETQSAMAAHLRALLAERGADRLAAAVAAEALAGAVLAALTVWTDSSGRRTLAGLVDLTREALEQVRPALPLPASGGVTSA